MIKPMLAPRDVPTPDQLRFPLLASPKLDGVRALIVDGVVTSRNGKPIPNASIQARFGKAWLNGMDGELIVGPENAPNVFQATMSGVMSREGSPLATFHVFDRLPFPGFDMEPYELRLLKARKLIEARGNKAVAIVNQTPILSAAALANYEAACVAMGYEGAMLRDPMGRYKFGRCTLKEAILLKLKRFEDAEAIVTGFEEEQENTNEAKRNAVGKLERSTKKAGKVGKGRLGALLVRDVETGAEFRVGTGYSAGQREAFWSLRDSLVGKLITYKHQPHGADEAPRFPVFKGFRDPQDVS